MERGGNKVDVQGQRRGRVASVFWSWVWIGGTFSNCEQNGSSNIPLYGYIYTSWYLIFFFFLNLFLFVVMFGLQFINGLLIVVQV